MTAYITVKDADSWQPIAKIYAETHELIEGDRFAAWHYLTWVQTLADEYEREYGRDAWRFYGRECYIDYVRMNAKKDTRYPDAFALVKH